ncbi:MAG: formate--tetrahydrofolate ligase [Thermoanaerobaculia bacterium]
MHIDDIAQSLGISKNDYECYGKWIAKVDSTLIDRLADRPDGRMIIVTAMTPTSTGEGKTVTSIGLAQTLRRLGVLSIATLRQPSLGPVFGVKGGATGGGLSEVWPRERINLHFTGDLHAVTSAHNLLAAMIDTHLFHGNALEIDPDSITWPRAVDMNDRALRQTIVSIDGRLEGRTRETGFVITAASEVMAILALATSREDLRRRLAQIVIGVTRGGNLVTADDLGATGAMAVLLNEAIDPNLVQTTDGTPAFVHAGPFANIAHGTSSVISQKLALKLADFVVNETGFAADLGCEKYFDIVMPATGIKPAAVVLIATVKALREHGSNRGEVPKDSVEALMRGFANLEKHIDNVQKFGVPMVVSINRFEGDSDDDLRAVKEFCDASGVESSITDFFGRGADGGIELAQKLVMKSGTPKSIYRADMTFEAKVHAVATEIYGASGVTIMPAAQEQLDFFTSRGFGHLPVCIAKTQSSLSDNPKLLGAPRGWTLTITEARLAAGAEFVVLVAGNMMLMPGLPKIPQAMKMDVDANAQIVGLR